MAPGRAAFRRSRAGRLAPGRRRRLPRSNWTALRNRCSRSCTRTSLASMPATRGSRALRERYVLTWSENQRFFHGALPLLQAFEQAGIDAVVLKGLALVARFYRDPGVRPMADVDVLVAPARCRARRRAGRAPRLAPALSSDPGLPPGEACGSLRPPDGRRVRPPLAGLRGGGHGRRRRRVPGRAPRPSRSRARDSACSSPTEQLLHVCGHAARWSPAPSVRWVTDAAVILREGADRLAALSRPRRAAALRPPDAGDARLPAARPSVAAIPPSVEAELARRPRVDARAARVSGPEAGAPTARGAARLRVQLLSRRAPSTARAPRLPPGRVGARLAGRGASSTRWRSRRARAAGRWRGAADGRAPPLGERRGAMTAAGVTPQALGCRQAQDRGGCFSSLSPRARRSRPRPRRRARAAPGSTADPRGPGACCAAGAAPLRPGSPRGR